MESDNVVFWIVAALTVGIVVAGALKAKPPLEVVPQLDLPRYLGTWYVIASIPTSFERRCVQGTTAHYTLLPNGQIEVVNACFSADGQRLEARGRAWIPDPKVPAKLKVSFVNLFGLWLFAGDYWVIDLADDYSYAVVGHPSRNYGWILSRTPTMPEEVLAGIRQRLEAKGYDWSRFRRVDQTMHRQP